MFQFIRNLFRLTRPLSNVKNVAIISLAFYLSKSQFHWVFFILGIVSLSCIFSGLYAYNAFCDLELDKGNNNKKQYALAVAYFGKKMTLIIAVLFSLLGLLLGAFINGSVFFCFILLLFIGILYSSSYTQFKNKLILDILFGASLTFLFRFIAAWFIFSLTPPPLLPILGLVSLKSGGYILYKGYDRAFLTSLNIKNSITQLSQRSIVKVSLIFFAIAIVSFALMCFNSVFGKNPLWGSLDIKFLWLLPFFIPPIIMQYLLFYKWVDVNPKYFRGLGLVFLLIIILLTLQLA